MTADESSRNLSKRTHKRETLDRWSSRSSSFQTAATPHKYPACRTVTYSLLRIRICPTCLGQDRGCDAGKVTRATEADGPRHLFLLGLRMIYDLTKNTLSTHSGRWF